MTHPSPLPPLRAVLDAVPAVVAGSLVVALAALFAVPVPGSAVPQSLQTLAVVVVGGLLGPRRGASALLLYLAMGALGLPVFAEGASGAGRLVGPTAGYLWGFVAAAGLTGWWVGPGRGLGGTWPGAAARCLAAMAAAHAVILAVGWGWLARSLGAGEALAEGVLPFLWGAVVKSAAGATVVVGWWWWRAGDDQGGRAGAGPPSSGPPGG